MLDSGAHQFFVQRIGPHRTLELVYTGRMLSGREAAEWGIVNHSVARLDLLRRVREVARAVAAGPTPAFVASKRLVRRITDEAPSLDEVLAAEAAAQGAASRTHDYQEGIGAFQEKRSPRVHRELSRVRDRRPHPERASRRPTGRSANVPEPVETGVTGAGSGGAGVGGRR